VVDARFAELAEVLGGITREQSVDLIREMDLLRPTISVPTTPRLLGLATLMTWWTLLVEGLIAVLFLCPPHRVVSTIANYLLLYFIVSVYPIAPVLGFAHILLVMGYAQCAANARITRLCYLIMFPGMLLFSTRHVVSFAFDQIDRIMM
jgi:hypothetical protein